MFRGVVWRGNPTVESFSSTLESLPEIPRTANRGRDYGYFRAAAEREGRDLGYAEGREQGIVEGRDAGFAQGREEATSQFQAEHAERLDQLTSDLQDLHRRIESAVAEWAIQAQEELESLGVQVAQKLLAAQLTLDRTIIVETAREALRQITETGRARIRVNPFDSPILQGCRDELLAATASLRGIEIVDDASILGGCIVETDRGVVDARPETKLEILEGGMEEAA